jgi:Cu+-exporting ATPase
VSCLHSFALENYAVMHNITSHIPSQIKCYHCGENCKDATLAIGDKHFCCNGCKTVYEILQENQLCTYYDLKEEGGHLFSSVHTPEETEKFAYLDLPEVRKKLMNFSNGKTGKVTFYLPQIHCSACIYLLENLYKINKAVTFSRIDFLKKQLSVTFSEDIISLREVVILLSRLGYEPYISLEDINQSGSEKQKPANRQQLMIARIAVAGFCFGNIMLLSFPEYFGFDTLSNHTFKYIFNILNISLSLPVFFFSGWEFLREAWTGLKNKYLNTDFPLALGMAVLFVRSLIEIIIQTGPGYLDTMTGLVFFLLIGKWFQQKTYDSLRYDRDFKSYFPVAVTVKKDEKILQVPITELQTGDRIVIRNQELIPADAILFKGDACIDYSFVTGESLPVSKMLGEIIYAGGRQAGNAIELEVIKPASQSYLTELWNNEIFQKEKTTKRSIQEIFNQNFTLILLTIAILAAGYWMLQYDFQKALNAFTAVLIVACPCALVLGSSFALGTAMQILGKFGFYLKNTQIIEKISQADAIVFDKTGTLTESKMAETYFVPTETELTAKEYNYLKLLSGNSTHPLARYIEHYLSFSPSVAYEISHFREYPGKGMEALIDNHWIVAGSYDFLREKSVKNIPYFTNARDEKITKVLVSIDSAFKGLFYFNNKYRKGIAELIHQLGKKYNLYLLSGDNEGEAKKLTEFFENTGRLHFYQSPAGKLEFIKNLQEAGANVMMLGDGLNDAGALQQSNTGIAVTDNIAHFTPASDVILDAGNLKYLNGFIRFCQKSVNVIKISLLIAIVYNLVGLSFAITGNLSPLVSAILMPVSSITVVLFTTLSVGYFKNSIYKN